MENNRYREEELEEQNNEQLNSNDEVKENKEVELNNKDNKSKNKKNNKYINKIHHLEKELSKKDEELKNLQNEMLKDRAELENFKKRTADERMKERKYANQYLIEDLLDMIDIFDTQVNKEVDNDVLKKYLMGFKMIDDQIKDILSRYGLSKIDCLNKKFDPSFHEAIETVNGDDEGLIIEVVRNGYMYKDRVIRPAKVKVIKKVQNEE